MPWPRPRTSRPLSRLNVGSSQTSLRPVLRERISDADCGFVGTFSFRGAARCGAPRSKCLVSECSVIAIVGRKPGTSGETVVTPPAQAIVLILRCCSSDLCGRADLYSGPCFQRFLFMNAAWVPVKCGSSGSRGRANGDRLSESLGVLGRFGKPCSKRGWLGSSIEKELSFGIQQTWTHILAV